MEAHKVVMMPESGGRNETNSLPKTKDFAMPGAELLRNIRRARGVDVVAPAEQEDSHKQYMLQKAEEKRRTKAEKLEQQLSRREEVKS